MSDDMASSIERPEFVTDEHLDFLDDLRASYPELTKPQAKKALVYWMHTFEGRHDDGSKSA